MISPAPQAFECVVTAEISGGRSASLDDQSPLDEKRPNLCPKNKLYKSNKDFPIHRYANRYESIDDLFIIYFCCCTLTQPFRI